MSSLSYLLARRSEKQKDLKTYRSRKTKLQSIKRNVENDFDGIITEAIKFDQETSSSLLQGLQGEELGVTNLCFDIDSEKEKSIYNDGKMYDVISNLNSEISRCTSEIERLENEIWRLGRQIAAAREAEAQACQQ